MGSSTDQSATARAKKRSQLWKKALLHSSLCFVMGFFTGFAPSSVSDWGGHGYGGAGISSHIVEAMHAVAAVNRSLLEQVEVDGEAAARPLVVVVTTTESFEGGRRAAALTRTAQALRLAAPPVLWVVAEAAEDAPATARLLRATGVMYRHLTYKENFTDAGEERHHQQNVALGHVERHRLEGVVLFAGLGDVYDLRFFRQLREISGFGAWAVATIRQKERKVVVEGPTCRSSRVTGWVSQDFSDGSRAAVGSPTAHDGDAAVRSRPQRINAYGFAFNSSVLWDPERWGRYPTSEPDTSQDSMKFVQQVALEDYSKLRGIPSDCSDIMVWHVETWMSSLLPPENKTTR